MPTNRSFPQELRELHKLDFDYADGEGIDFEPYDDFVSLEETRQWFHAWTGNPKAMSDAYLVFGQDGTGGYAAIWTTRAHSNILNQPIVFFGSEGEMGVVAQNFSDYLWVLASGHGPYEAVANPDDDKDSNALFTEFATKFATTPRRKINELLQSANDEFPDFKSNILSQCC